jgi:hypothetical protein
MRAARRDTVALPCYQGSPLPVTIPTWLFFERFSQEGSKAPLLFG